jgi:hypothetical protein
MPFLDLFVHFQYMPKFYFERYPEKDARVTACAESIFFFFLAQLTVTVGFITPISTVVRFIAHPCFVYTILVLAQERSIMCPTLFWS